MIIIEQINCSVLLEFENNIPNKNVRVGGDYYDQDKICPPHEGQCYKIRFEESDIQRIFILGDTQAFIDLTYKRNYRMSDIIPDKVKPLLERKSLLNGEPDLRSSSEWSPVFVSRDTNSDLIAAIDGNHRLMAHFLHYKGIEGVNAYLFVHSRIETWAFINTIRQAQTSR